MEDRPPHVACLEETVGEVVFESAVDDTRRYDAAKPLGGCAKELTRPVASLQLEALGLVELGKGLGEVGPEVGGAGGGGR
jgi:hypothetical protein